MKSFLFLFLLTISWSSFAFKVMTFNTMCDFCKGSNFFQYEKRADSLRQIIELHQADLIALQEVRSFSQIEFIAKNMKDYQIISNNSGLISYADPSLLIHKDFKIIESGQFWLGPDKETLNFGWKLALPRQVIWAKLRLNKNEFIFASTHFDNRLENLAGAADLVHNYFSSQSTPVIFAGDTNLTTEMLSYRLLTKNFFLNSYEVVKKLKVHGKKLKERDLCYLKKGKRFPACRVDHILISKNFPYTPTSFTIDLTRFKDKFPSDHRPVIVNFEALKQSPL